ncbi:MAG: DNA internalization-related competence protein ComEC/Rec2, partial [Thiomicrorhabdus sp.]|nr:DNA internalization-related competence protein ComEC/Rec2 [Thiomicrorhabdus sp.]
MSFFGMFIQFVIGFIVTVILFYQLTEFPPIWFGWLLLILLLWALWFIVFYPKRHFYFSKRNSLAIKTLSSHCWQNRLFHVLLSAIIGMNVVFWQAFFAPSLSSEFLNQKNRLEIQVATIPEIVQNEHFTKIVFQASLSKITQLKNAMPTQNHQAWWFLKPKIKLSWYLDHSEMAQIIKQGELPRVGENWLFYGKLKSNHAAMNLTSRDYEAWLFQNHIVGRSTVSGLYLKNLAYQNKTHQKVKIPVATRLRTSSMLDWRVWRAQAVQHLHQVFDASPFKAIYLGMTVGDKSFISQQQWSIFQQTGTIHLMAISGLHMSIMALLGFWLFKQIWRTTLYRYQIIDLQPFASLGGLLFATVYLLLSGAAIPTQRAWIMVATVLLFILVRRQFQPWSALAMAALLIILWDSRAVLSSGFWLSFMAVAIIFLGLRLYEKQPRWQQFLAIQLMLTVGLAPFILWSFYQLPLYGLFANLLAVPFVSIIGLPGLLIIIFVSLFSVDFATNLLQMLDWFWQQLWFYLLWLTKLPDLQLQSSQHSVIWLIAVCFTLFLSVLLYRFLAKRYQWQNTYLTLGFVGFFLVLVFYPYPHSRPNGESHNQQAWLTVLDVGQGQAIVIETANHLVVYDTGAKWGNATDASKVAVIPYIQAQGWPKIDLLMVSHSDMDHAGGTQSTLQKLKVKQALSGQAAQLNEMLHSEQETQQPTFMPCLAGQKWNFDGIQFEVLSPFKDAKQKGLKTDNDLSCVLKISNGSRTALLMGDLSQKGEKALLQHYPG